MISKKMTDSDVPEVAELLGNAFADKFTEKTTLPKRTAKILMKLLWLEEAGVFGMQPYILEDKGEIVAAFGITGMQKRTLTLSFTAKVMAAVHRLGVRPFIAFARKGLETSRTPDKDELYIDFIAVKESRRNETIGHRVMEEIEALNVLNPRISKSSLYVLKNNEPAIHLYKKFGFTAVDKYERSDYLFMMKKQ
ncbi:Acetyltransferase (GNAT) family protein [Alkalibacterium subtropicum]|uniref:Acetyltransferase (GNAT) family protein n=1 Tax=Alkalibacterium subtropicum TaxID=753702 RepID=A0A1I1GZG6_9LACT|nr:GNAT family N-acetyltransferase [Alkalibacterium subtropicum]SFC16896.1 Acetyltransferase (GNAT) family protein [Alkalibacterium subtropicum]